MAYKILEDVISSSVSEARNSPANAATIVVAGTADVVHGDTVVITHDQGGKRAYYPLQAVKIDYANGNTTIQARPLLAQLFNCILPLMADQSGEASVILKAVLTELNTQGYADIYINNDNFTASSRTYAVVNVSHRKVGELFQDICKDTQFVMWMGYDEVNDKFNAFFFQPVTAITQDLGALKEGVNIVSETVQKGSLDDVVNYVLMYYFPRRYPYGEEWTEPADIESGTAAWTRAADFSVQARVPGSDREVRLFQSGPHTTVASDTDGNAYIDASDTTGFTAEGGILIDGCHLLYYTSITGNHFNLVYSIGAGVYLAGSSIVQGFLVDKGGAAKCETVSISMPPITTTLDQLDLYIESIVGTPGPIKVYAVNSFNGIPTKLLGTITPTAAGWQTLELSETFGTTYFYGLQFAFVIEEAHSNGDYYTLGMGPASAGDFFNWYAWGSDHYGGISDPLQQISIALWSGLMTAPNTTWVVTGALKALDQAAFLSVSGVVMNDNRQGIGCIRFVGAGSAEVISAIDILEYDRIHFYYKGNLSQVEIVCQGGSYLQALSAASDWQEEILTLAAMLKSGTPTSTLIGIKFTNTGGSGWVDGLYFLAPTSGLPVTVSDAISIAAYGQHPEVIYAKGVTESSYAYALAEAIIADKKTPKYTGTIVVKDVPQRWTPQKSVRVILASKSIDEVMDIFQVTHTMDGLAVLEVNSFEFDYAKVLAGLESGIENLQISVGATPQVDESAALQATSTALHAARHAHGGSDEINVGGLSGILVDNQPTTWALVALKPSSSAADIDSAVSLKHAAAHTHPESEVTSLVDDLGAKVAKSLFDPYTILMATADDTPIALTVTEQTLIGRITGGTIAALSIAQIQTLLGITAAGAALMDDANAAAQLVTLGLTPIAAELNYVDNARSELQAQIDAKLTFTPTNLVANGEFETDTAGWSGTNATLSRETGSPLVGTGSLKILLTGAGGWGQYTVTTITGHQYLMVCLAKSTAAAGRLCQLFKMGGGNVYGPTRNCSAGTTQMTLSFAAAATTTYLAGRVVSGIADEILLLDSVTCYDLTAGTTATVAELNNIHGITAAGAALLDDANAAAQLVTLGATPIAVDGTPNTDHTANGPQTNTFLSGATIAAMQLCYMGSGGKWLLTDADSAATTMGMLAISLEAKNDTEAMNVALPDCFIADASWSWTPGVILYVSGTPGVITTVPGANIRNIGWAVSSTVIYFKPGSVYYSGAAWISA